MQLMCDAVTVLGSRHGVLLNPAKRNAGIIRFDVFEQMPVFQLRAGAVIGGQTCVFPFCEGDQPFDFYDQRLTPCTMSVIGIHAASALKIQLTIATPFRPRDAEFSTTPVLAISLSAERIAGHFRWVRQTCADKEIELFVEFAGERIAVAPGSGPEVDLVFTSHRRVSSDPGKTIEQAVPQRDRLVAVDTTRRGTRFVKTVFPDEPGSEGLTVGWCTHCEPELEILGQRYPFQYATRFADLDAVADWARTNTLEILGNARRVDGIIEKNNCSSSVNKLFANTLHAWLMDSWWVNRDGRDWFSVWEGSCYFHSTVDVEFTQSPFYLAVWPELLKIELDFWPEFSKDGSRTLGERGKNTLFLSHDAGQFSRAGGQEYTHEMEVEETANYLILSFAYYKRTGDASILYKHAAIIEKYLAFLAACDTTGNGIPDKGVANTIDDASPAVQFGTEQIYLAVKALAAFACGAELLSLLGRSEPIERCRTKAAKIRATIAERGWAEDHFVTLLRKDGILKNPWSGVVEEWKEIPGWDAPHIYTVNGLAPLDMVGFSLGLNEAQIRQDLLTATGRCLREYGCVHTDFQNQHLADANRVAGLAGVSRNPGWISMNMLRDIAAFYRGVDLRALADRYWDWQVTTNTQEPKIFFETFNGNNLCFYPRGVAIWGFFDALAGLVIDRVAGVEKTTLPFAQIRVPRLDNADWKKGTCTVIDNCGDR